MSGQQSTLKALRERLTECQISIMDTSDLAGIAKSATSVAATFDLLQGINLTMIGILPELSGQRRSHSNLAAQMCTPEIVRHQLCRCGPIRP